MSNLILDMQRLYERTFGSKPYVVPQQQPGVETNGYWLGDTRAQNITTLGGAPLRTKDAFGVDIWLPTELYNLPAGVGVDGRIKLYYGTVNISAPAPMGVETPLAERKGTAKEDFSLGDYAITLKGFFIDKETRSLPGNDLKILKDLHEQGVGVSFSIWNAITDIILADTSNASYEQQQVVIRGFELPAVEGGRESMRPYIINLKSDNIFSLEVE